MKLNLVTAAIENSTMSFPLAALAIAAAVEKDAPSWTCIHNEHLITDNPEKAAADAVANSDAVALFVYLWNRPWMERFAKELKKLRPELPVLAGGADISANEGCFDEGSFYTNIDYLFIGEGEITVPETLMRGVSANGKAVVVRNEKPVDPALLPSPFSGKRPELLENREGVLWEMTRGCPFGCSFCFESKGEGKVRAIPLERLEKELDEFINAGISHVFVLDPTFDLEPERTERILKMLIEKAPADMRFTFEVRAELLTKPTAEFFSQLFCSLQIGLQTSNRTVLETINRRYSEEKFLNGIALLNSYGIVFGLDLIIGLPKDSLESFRRTLDYAIELKPSNLDIFPLALLPGTTVRERAAEYGISYNPASPYTIISSPSFSQDELAQALLLKEKADEFYTAGQACLWLSVFAKAAGMRPVEVLDEYVPDAGSDIYELQSALAEKLLAQRGKNHLSKALLSFIELQQGFAYLRETGENPVVELWYDPADLARLETESAEDFVHIAEPFKEKTEIELFYEDGQPFFRYI